VKSKHAYIGVRMTGLSTFRKHRVDTISRYFRSRIVRPDVMSASVSHPPDKVRIHKESSERRREINCQPWTVQKLAQDDNSKVIYLRARFF